MALQDLIISHDKITQELLEGVLRHRVELIQEGHQVFLTKEGFKMPKKAQILLFLAGGKAWELINQKEWLADHGQLERQLGIMGNTLRPILKELRGSFLVQSVAGKYKILPRGIFELEAISQHDAEDVSGTSAQVSSPRQGHRKKKAGGNKMSTADVFAVLMKEGFFETPREAKDIHDELSRRGIIISSTSIPAYILPMIRNNSLTRDRKERGKKKVWVYKLP